MAPKKTQPADEVPAVPADGGQLADAGGWFRNATGGHLTLIDPPSVTVEPGEVVWRNRTPSHYGLEPAAEPEPQPEPVPVPLSVTDHAPQTEE